MLYNMTKTIEKNRRFWYSMKEIKMSSILIFLWYDGIAERCKLDKNPGIDINLHPQSLYTLYTLIWPILYTVIKCEIEC